MRACLLSALWLFSLGGTQARAAGMGGGAEEPVRLIVGFSPDADEDARAASLRESGLQVVERIEALRLAVVESGAREAAKASQSLMASPGVLHVEEDVYVDWLSGASLGTPESMSLGHIPLPGVDAPLPELPPFRKTDATQGEFPWGVERVKAKDAWATTMGEGVRVAVVDTGIDFNHPDLAPNYAGGYNAVDSSDPPMDDHGHGTHVAGTVAAARDGRGVVGVAPKARLYAVKVLDKKGGGRLTSIIKGLVWVANNGMQVANMSLGSPTGSLFMRMAVRYARSSGVVIVAAAGNSGGRVSYPGAYGDVIAVAASDSKDGLAGFSSRGKEVDFIAPGVDVLSTVPGGGYARYSGTSMATPHVAGLAALAVTQGARDLEGVMAALRGAAQPIQGLKPEEQGAGMVSAGLLVGN